MREAEPQRVKKRPLIEFHQALARLIGPTNAALPGQSAFEPFLRELCAIAQHTPAIFPFRVTLKMLLLLLLVAAAGNSCAKSSFQTEQGSQRKTTWGS